MRTQRIGIVGIGICVAVSISGCTGTNGDEMSENLTWKEAKAKAQSMEIEIADSLPPTDVVRVDQQETGTLLSCSSTEHNWNGSTTVTVVAGLDVNALVSKIADTYKESAYEVTRLKTASGDPRIQIANPQTAESYLVSRDGIDTIRIASGSPCFTLPDDVYPGGEF